MGNHITSQHESLAAGLVVSLRRFLAYSWAFSTYSLKILNFSSSSASFLFRASIVALAYASFSALSRSISRSCSRVVFLNEWIATLGLQFSFQAQRCPYSGWSSSRWKFPSGARVTSRALWLSVPFTRCWLASCQNHTGLPPHQPSSHSQSFTGFPGARAIVAGSARKVWSWSWTFRHRPISAWWLSRSYPARLRFCCRPIWTHNTFG